MTDAISIAVPAMGHWDENAGFWLKIIRERRDRYRTERTDAAVLDAVGDCTGLDVLDVGCGEGYMTRELVRRGAGHANGIDKAADLISAARGDGRPEGRRSCAPGTDVVWNTGIVSQPYERAGCIVQVITLTECVAGELHAVDAGGFPGAASLAWSAPAVGDALQTGMTRSSRTSPARRHRQSRPWPITYVRRRLTATPGRARAPSPDMPILSRRAYEPSRPTGIL